MSDAALPGEIDQGCQADSNGHPDSNGHAEREVTSQVGEPGLRGEASEREPGVDLTSIAGRLSAAEAALERIEHGTYGRCSVCGGEIDGERRASDPLSDRCAGC